MSPRDLEGRNVILTGASRGLGARLARALWRRGANLLLTARSEEGLSLLKNDLLPSAGAGQTLDAAAADLADVFSPRAIVRRAEILWSRIDVLINNAALQGPIGPVWMNPEEEWRLTLQVNLLAPVALCREVLPGMIARRSGKIINLSGGGAASPRPRFSAYASAKAALVRFSETIALEVGEHNIQVNCVAPGAMPTDMTRSVLAAGPETAGAGEVDRARRTAASDELSAERAAELCCHLASPAGSSLTGKLISAAWDPWERLEARLEELRDSDIYTLRRIVPRDRGKEWS